MSSVNLKGVRFILGIFLFASVNTLNIPSYHKPCKFSDPQFEKCAVSVANAVMENYRKGDTTFIGAGLKDLTFPFVNLTDNIEASVNISDVHLLGCQDLKILKVKKVPNKNKLETVVLLENIKIPGEYSYDIVLNGKHIVQKGKGQVTFFGVHFKSNLEWKLVEKNGDKYLEVTEMEVQTDINNIMHEVEGVDNNTLDADWAEYMARILPSVTPYLHRILHAVTDTIFKQIPYNKLFLD